MYVDFVYEDDTKTFGPFKKVKIEGTTLIADGNAIAFHNRDESYWVEDYDAEKAIDDIVIRSSES